MSKPIPKPNLHCEGYSAYWDSYSIACVEDMYSAAQYVVWRAGYVMARKEDKGR